MTQVEYDHTMDVLKMPPSERGHGPTLRDTTVRDVCLPDGIRSGRVWPRLVGRGRYPMSHPGPDDPQLRKWP